MMGFAGVGDAASKAGLLLSLLPRHPLEFYDRMLAFLNVRFDRWWARSTVNETNEWEEVIQATENALGRDLGIFVDECHSVELMDEVGSRIQTNLSNAPFPLAHNADFTLGRFCYCVCRATRPAVVLETGVAYGVTSAFILKALQINGWGVLHSVDLPPLGHNADDFVGVLIPDKLKERWRLHRGVSRRVLPWLLPQLGRVNIFLHDSLHTYRNMRWEFEIVTSFLARPGIVLADDVEYNHAFCEWVSHYRPAFWAILREEAKKDMFGVSVLRDPRSPRS